MPRPPVNRLPLLVVAGLLVIGIAVPMTGAELGLGSTVSPNPSGAASPSGDLAAVPSGSAPSPSVPASSPSASSPPAATPSPAPAVVATPIVPVTQFRSPVTATNRAELAQVLAGTSARYEALTLVRSEADAILAALGVERPSDPARLVLAKDAATLTRDLAKHRKRLAFIRAADVTPAVRALAWGDRSLFGVGRVTKDGDWRLNAQLPERGDEAVFDAGATWTLFAGGDILLDRGVYETLRVKGRGEDFPFDGGTAEITSRCKDCSPLGWDLPRTRRTGNAGVVRELMTGADIAIANFENPAPNRFTWHTSKTVFTADPTLIDGLVGAGIDYVSIANNHIGDAGDNGLLQTIANLRKRGLKYSGAGKDLAAAQKPAILDANGTKVGILAYDAIAPGYHAAKGEPGSSKLTIKAVQAGVKAARKAGAKVVIVFPHWGVEYRYSPFQNQQRLARQIIDAGADMIIGNHAHYAAAVEIYKGKPIWYALGNFVFDQTWSEPTMEGITLELTFQGAQLRQIRMRPHIILDKAQPNFLDPARDGRFVLGPIYDASKGLLPY
ncbi:MAG TPA: CapA family protein [Candidatus Limnocylindrales bacterium]|nr:CapA family protein [Candidatus Limnocylindrales bacterium]